ncbi:3-oxoacyl-[acyl-carrier protein] reductase [Novosphingobium hassiacum]|uniref:3-oxoacyl-[acyl-carrier protein] reductase n=1 Tax=Novosphingobium hassiacum TaxID=173676 RepID=A0A7W6EXK6_9SPHN|nr:SDR family oxidoreductase [Novosphingobium hassiacum]MBB3862175.1 3-oxoacyl-[acyl-carrier protein] reductase [Novosphingobium hassiacum]
MDFGLTGKVALVSGGSKGMGRAAAEELAREGARVMVVARTQDAIDETVAAIRAVGGIAEGLSADMTDPDAIAGAVAQCKARLGSEPDIVIANVYGTARLNFDTAQPQDFREGYDLLVVSAVHLAKATVPAMKARGWGRIVTIGSFCVKKPHWQIPLLVDNVTRAAAAALSKSLSNELGVYGITVNTIAPGFIATDMAVAWMGELAREQGQDPAAAATALDRTIPLGRQGTSEEMGAAVAFLCSTRASYITGQLIMVDGGLVGTPY